LECRDKSLLLFDQIFAFLMIRFFAFSIYLKFTKKSKNDFSKMQILHFFFQISLIFAYFFILSFIF
tara:strand:- start:645 stop:842 length:198 start_codon:yes stop_codon:yes gene_type:complete